VQLAWKGGQAFWQQDHRDWSMLAPPWPGSLATPAVVSAATLAMVSVATPAVASVVTPDVASPAAPIMQASMATPAVASAVTAAVQASVATPLLPTTLSERWFPMVPASMAGQFCCCECPCQVVEVVTHDLYLADFVHRDGCKLGCGLECFYLSHGMLSWRHVIHGAQQRPRVLATLAIVACCSLSLAARHVRQCWLSQCARRQWIQWWLQVGTQP